MDIGHAEKFNVFGRIILVEKHTDGWRAYYLGTHGKKRPADFVIPADIHDGELMQYLDRIRIHGKSVP